MTFRLMARSAVPVWVVPMKVSSIKLYLPLLRSLVLCDVPVSHLKDAENGGFVESNDDWPDWADWCVWCFRVGCLIAWKLGCLIGWSVVCQYFDKSDKLLTCGATALKKNMLIPLYNSHGFCRLKCPSTWGDEVYSGSLHCGDRNLVISISLQQEAWLVALKLFCRMISGPFLGALCDYHGRNLELPGGQGPLSLGPADLGIFGKPNHPSQFGVYPNNRSGWWFQTWILFSIILWDNPSHWLSYFSRLLKPPTRHKPQTSLGMGKMIKMIKMALGLRIYGLFLCAKLLEANLFWCSASRASQLPPGSWCWPAGRLWFHPSGHWALERLELGWSWPWFFWEAS